MSARNDWLVVVDLGTAETFRYLFEDSHYAEARATGRSKAKAEAVERHLPTSLCDVYVVAADDPSRGPLDPNRCTFPACDGETHYGTGRDAVTNEDEETGPCPFA